ncbi:zf-HC2 domain-containing protein [Paenibacillus sp. CMAA1364]
MKEINCTIIQDVLPLYIDEVVSQDTKEMVDEHLQHCATCQQEYESMNQNLYIPAENNVSLIHNISKKWRTKKMIISICSILVTAIILMGTFTYILYYETVIPYSKDLFKIEMKNENQLVSHYYGKNYAVVNATHPMQLVIDGEKKNVSFIFYTKTIADSPSRNLINNGESRNQQEHTFNLVESEITDAVYYVDYDAKKSTEGNDYWDSILERAVLIWEK